MAHFARLDSNNNVIDVIVVDNLNCFDFDEGCECEEMGIAYCQDLYGSDTRWVQTSYHGSRRGCHPGIGWTYDENTDTFKRSKPFESWVWNFLQVNGKHPLKCQLMYVLNMVYHMFMSGMRVYILQTLQKDGRKLIQHL